MQTIVENIVHRTPHLSGRLILDGKAVQTLHLSLNDRGQHVATCYFDPGDAKEAHVTVFDMSGDVLCTMVMRKAIASTGKMIYKGRESNGNWHCWAVITYINAKTHTFALLIGAVNHFLKKVR